MKKKINNKKQSIKEIEDSRIGGQIALAGYNYQVLYSCYLLLEFLINDERKIRLEGIEDVDTFVALTDDNIRIEHIQLKHSIEKQDASFFKKILKNFLEVYLFDKTNDNRFFVLIYDFAITNGHLQKLCEGRLYQKSKSYWIEIIEEIKLENNKWDWPEFNFDHFVGQLKFKKINKRELLFEIEKDLIEKYHINIGNEQLYVNGLFYLCFNKMKERGSIDHLELTKYIQSIKDHINKGVSNPAHKWIEKIVFDDLINKNKNNYYEGKKAEPSDIVNQLPIRRKNFEDIIENSIINNSITVIKSSSGQGKTTLAWQVAFNLKDQYIIYKLNWCNEVKELDNIVEYFKSRIKIGEKILIVLDGLDIQLKEWNILAQYLSSRISINYSLLITTREDDWYSFSGDPTNLRDMKIIDLALDANQAKEIYLKLKETNKIHASVNNWQTPWEMVSLKGLLIEYIYLLTHGEMISERISQQVKNISQSIGSTVKLEILRQIAFADIMGIKLPVKDLINQFNSTLEQDIDFNELLKSIENEFYIRIIDQKYYVEGLHPVRSQHLVARLHEYIHTSDTILKILNIVDEVYISKLYSNIPFYISGNKDIFYRDLVESSYGNNYSYFLNAIKGLYSGSVLEYYSKNKTSFDDADEHGGLFLLLSEVNPFNRFEEVETEIKTLTEMKRIFPNDDNIGYLHSLSGKMDKFTIENSDFYYYSKYLYEKLKIMPLQHDISDYAYLANWLIKTNKNFDIVTSLFLDDIFLEKERWGIDAVAELMYLWHSLNKEQYYNFLSRKKQEILRYLKYYTKSMNIYESREQKEIHVEYILLPDDIDKANQESVTRLYKLCKVLPIYETYCADAIRPSLDIINSLNLPDAAHKQMSIRNIVITFNSEFAKLWSDTIMSNYECVSIYEWLCHWTDLRKEIIKIIKLNVQVLEKLLSKQRLNNELLNLIDNLRDEISKSFRKEKLFPHENRAFEKPQQLPEGMFKIKGGYFSSISNYINQFVSIVKKANNDSQRLAIFNLREAETKLKEMQFFFRRIVNETNNEFLDYEKLCDDECLWINKLIILNDYYLQTDNHFFNYTLVDYWNKQKDKQLISDVTAKIKQENENNYEYIFPSSIIEEDNTLKFPIIIKNFDMFIESEIMALLINLSSVAEINLHYIYLLISNDENIVLQTGMSISFICLGKLKSYLDSGDESIIQDMIPPLPIEISDRILNCFDSNFYVSKKQDLNNMSGIDSLYLQLWEYSQYSKYISSQDEDEKLYLYNLQMDKKNEIDAAFEKVRNTLSSNFIEKFNFLKNNIIEENYYLDETELNILINEILKSAKEMCCN